MSSFDLKDVIKDPVPYDQALESDRARIDQIMASVHPDDVDSISSFSEDISLRYADIIKKTSRIALISEFGDSSVDKLGEDFLTPAFQEFSGRTRTYVDSYQREMQRGKLSGKSQGGSSLAAGLKYVFKSRNTKSDSTGPENVENDSCIEEDLRALGLKLRRMQASVTQNKSESARHLNRTSEFLKELAGIYADICCHLTAAKQLQSSWAWQAQKQTNSRTASGGHTDYTGAIDEMQEQTRVLEEFRANIAADLISMKSSRDIWEAFLAEMKHHEEFTIPLWSALTKQVHLVLRLRELDKSISEAQDFAKRKIQKDGKNLDFLVDRYGSESEIFRSERDKNAGQIDAVAVHLEKLGQAKKTTFEKLELEIEKYRTLSLEATKDQATQFLSRTNPSGGTLSGKLK